MQPVVYSRSLRISKHAEWTQGVLVTVQFSYNGVFRALNLIIHDQRQLWLHKAPPDTSPHPQSTPFP